MTDLKHNWISGRWVAIDAADLIDERIDKVNPSKSSESLGVVLGSIAHTQQAVAAARQASTGWQSTTESARWNALHRLADLISKEQDPIAKTITTEIGKPIWESRQEVKLVLNKFLVTEKESMAFTRDFSVPYAVKNVAAQCIYKPHGVLGILGPFNFPLHLVMGHVIPALATGNCVVFKPSEKAPLTGAILATLFDKAAFPPGVFNLVQGGQKVGEALVQHPDVDGILFTGSYPVGRRIKELTLDQPGKILALEMGGKNTSVIWNDADLSSAAAAVLQSAMITCGQRCTATSQVLVHESVFNPVVDLLKTMAEQMKIGDPRDESNFLGPIISKEAMDRLGTLLTKARNLGGKNIVEMAQQPATDGFFVHPSIHRFESLPAPQESQNGYHDEEIFGPDLAIYPVSSMEAAVTLINRSRYGLALSVFSKNHTTFRHFLDACRVGVCNFNRPTTGASASLPFGGQKASGNHFPTALFATRYCTYPVATLMEEEKCSIEKVNGFSILKDS